MLVTILATITLMFMILSMLLTSKYYQLNKAYIEAQNMLRSLIFNDNLVEQSISTVCERFGIKREDFWRAVNESKSNSTDE